MPYSCVSAFATTPQAHDDSYTTDWDTLLEVFAPGVLGNDIDADGDTLEAHIVTPPSRGQYQLLRDGTFRYLPEPGFAGDVTLIYKAWDGTSGTNATVTITVTPGNQCPIATDDYYVTAVDEPLYTHAPGVLANDSDPEQDDLSSFLVSSPASGTLGFHQDGSFWYVPESGFSGEVNFTYRASDGSCKDEATVTILVADTEITCPERANNSHAFWLPGISRHFYFEPGTALFQENTDGTASLTGEIFNRDAPQQRFSVSVHFDGFTTNPPPGSPKKELARHFYVENGGTVDVATWYYYENYQGVLTGLDDFEGAVVGISRRGPAFQIGDGASGKNTNYGGSGWFNWQVATQGNQHTFSNTSGRGDINIDLNPCP